MNKNRVQQAWNIEMKALEHSSRKTYIRHITRFCDWLEDNEVVAEWKTEKAIMAYVIDLAEAGYTASSGFAAIAATNLVKRVFVEKQVKKDAVVDWVKRWCKVESKNKDKTQPILYEQVHQLFQTGEPSWNVFVSLSYTFLLRHSEVCAVQWEHINEDVQGRFISLKVPQNE